MNNVKSPRLDWSLSLFSSIISYSSSSVTLKIFDSYLSFAVSPKSLAGLKPTISKWAP